MMVKTANRIRQTIDPLDTLASLDAAKLLEQRETLERERDAAVASFQNKIDALKVLERAAYIRDHGKPPRKPLGPRKKKEPTVAANGQTLASREGTAKDRIIKYLSVQPAKTRTIAADLGIPEGTVSGTLHTIQDFVEHDQQGRWHLKREAKSD